ncbi:MAG: hypothetical protein WCO05_03850 [Candidatus Moraniibacteriota bacterium]
MEGPELYLKSVKEKHSAKETLLFENRISDLMFVIMSKLSKRVKSVQVMKDDNFVHRRDRTANDIHVFFELKNGQFFHLKAYTKHMLDMDDIPVKKIFLTGYVQSSISQIGGKHSLKQGWYEWSDEVIASEIVAQNQALFLE